MRVVASGMKRNMITVPATFSLPLEVQAGKSQYAQRQKQTAKLFGL
jgi:hypothetical protein